MDDLEEKVKKSKHQVPPQRGQQYDVFVLAFAKEFKPKTGNYWHEFKFEKDKAWRSRKTREKYLKRAGSYKK